MTFPDGFQWGAATASYQIEGSVGADGRGTSIWDTFSRTPGAVLHGDTGDVASDHYRRWEADVALMADLGLQTYRFSFAWSRIQPEGRGKVNERGLDFYRRLVDALLEHSIVPVPTLYHWDLPQPLQDEGGWANRATAERFAEYAGLVYDALADRIGRWITLNEPWCSAFLGYAIGVHAPGITDRQQSLAACHHLLLGHGLAVQALRGLRSEASDLGITLNLAPVTPATDDPADVDAARRADGVQNRLFLDPVLAGTYPADLLADFERDGAELGFIRDGDVETIAAPLDFLGVNYYMGNTVRADDDAPDEAPRMPGLRGVTGLPPTEPLTAMGWGIQPEGLEAILRRVHDDYPPMPLAVTENGIAVDDYVDPEGGVDDEERIAYLDAHFRAAHRAIAAGVDLRSYFVWSLMDNFEWAQGYSKRFGLVWVDYPSGERLPKASARWYAQVIARNGLPD